MGKSAQMARNFAGLFLEFAWKCAGNQQKKNGTRGAVKRTEVEHSANAFSD
jgi:hypothetical protein